MTSSATRSRARELTVRKLNRAVLRPAVVERSPADREVVIRALRSLALVLYDHQREVAGSRVDAAALCLSRGDREGERVNLELAVEVEPKVGRVCIVEGLLRA